MKLSHRSSFFLLLLAVSVILLSTFIILTLKSKKTASLPSAPHRCGVQNCHGLDVSCGSNIVGLCTMEYQLGDRCRRFAQCQVKSGNCQTTYSSDYQSCKSCVQKCNKQNPKDPAQAFQCESTCDPQLKK